MVPGVLDRRLAVRPISRISPSRYYAMKQCSLREVWLAGGEPHLLPISPAARLGTVIHELLEDAGRTRLAPPERRVVERRWEILVGETETTMRTSWLERHFVPLRSSVPHFEVRQVRAQRRALAVAEAAARARSEPGHDKAMVGIEKWVATSDASVGGYIDHVLDGPEGVVLCDYKSGSIHDPTAGPPSAVVKESFAVQMRLYAALYATTKGI